MKNFPIVLALVGLVLFTTSCEKDTSITTIEPSSKITMVEKDINNFNAIEVAGDFEVLLTFSATEESVTVEANENLQDLIVVEKSGKTLEIHLQPNTTIYGTQTTKIHITTQEIIDFKVAGDAIIELKNTLATDDLNMDFAGDSQFMGQLDTKDFSATVAGDAQLNLSGYSTKVDLRMAGDGITKDYDFICDKLDITLAGEAEAFITVNETINVSAAGESILHYKGTGTIENQQVVGEAKVKKED